MPEGAGSVGWLTGSPFCFFSVDWPAMPPLPELSSAELPSDAVELARIADAWGVKGWFKVQPYGGDAGALLGTRVWYLQPAEKGRKSFFDGTVVVQLRQARAHSDGVVAWAQGVDERDGAEALRGARVFVPRSEFPPLPQGEYYWVDLIGLAVLNREGVALGEVRELLAAGPQTTLVLRYDEDGKHRERMIPFVGAYVDAVDLAARRITVDWQPDY